MKKVTPKKSSAKPTKKMAIGGSMMTPMTSSPESKCPPNCSKGIDYEKRRRQQKKLKPKPCRKGTNGQMICD